MLQKSIAGLNKSVDNTSGKKNNKEIFVLYIIKTLLNNLKIDICFTGVICIVKSYCLKKERIFTQSTVLNL
jgi:hypothetical protein